MSTNRAGVILTASSEVTRVKAQSQSSQSAYRAVLRRFTEVLLQHGLLHALGDLQAMAASNPAAAQFQEGLNSAMKAVSLPNAHLAGEENYFFRWAMYVDANNYTYAKPYLDQYLTFLRDYLLTE